VNRPHLELADVFRSLGVGFIESEGQALSCEQRQAFQDIIRCRTAELGGHVEQCDQCGYQQVAYNSCRNRHCPKCQAAARAEWLQARQADLLPVEYFHVVFTLPKQLCRLALQNKRLIYGMLFRAASETLVEIALDPKHLGAEIGFLIVLHTWGQMLQHHPHVHCVIPGSGLSPQGSRWINCRKGFFLPVRVLSRLFRGKFVSFLREASQQGRLFYNGQTEHLNGGDHLPRLLRDVSKVEWVVYAKRPFGGPEQVLKYLARYTHRVAISNQRLIELKEGRVLFRWKDYADGSALKETSLDAREFTRRFLLHILPRGFVRIRHYGFLANRCRQDKLTRCRQLLADQGGCALSLDGAMDRDKEIPTNHESALCPACGKGRLVIVGGLDHPPAGIAMLSRPVTGFDTS
jgi:hypothetical protein